jgi:hypothetical protein
MWTATYAVGISRHKANSTELSPPLQAKGCSNIHENSCLLWNQKDDYRVHKIQLLKLIPNGMNSVHNLTWYFLPNGFNTVFPSTYRCPMWRLSFRLPASKFIRNSHLFMHAAWLAHLIFLYFIIMLIILDVLIVKPLIIHLDAESCYFICLPSKHSQPHPVINAR